MFGIPDAGGGMHPLGLVLLLAYAVIGIGGFVLIARSLMSLSERLAVKRERELEDLRRRVASGETETTRGASGRPGW